MDHPLLARCHPAVLPALTGDLQSACACHLGRHDQFRKAAHLMRCAMPLASAIWEPFSGLQWHCLLAASASSERQPPYSPKSSPAVVEFERFNRNDRDAGAVQTLAVYLAIGVNLDGHKEVLELWIAQTEGAKFWLQVITELKNRGVQDIFIACVDGLKGFPQGDRPAAAR